MSIFASLFGSSQQAPAQQTQQQQMPQPGNMPATQPPAQQTQPQNNNVPGDQQQQLNQQTQASQKIEGLDQFNDLWKPVESPAGGQSDQLFNVDPKQLMEAASKIDFAKVIDQQQLQSIAQGGEAAMAAFSQALNKVAQTVYAQNAHATTKIVEQAVAKTRESVLGELPQHIKRQTVSDTLRAENPAFSHPAASPILGALEQQLTMKFPNATPNELSKMARDYLGSFANSIAPQQSSQQQTNSNSKDMDWDAYLN